MGSDPNAIVISTCVFYMWVVPSLAFSMTREMVDLSPPIWFWLCSVVVDLMLTLCPKYWVSKLCSLFIVLCVTSCVVCDKLCCVWWLLVGRVYCFSCLVCIFLFYVYLLYFFLFTLDAGLLARSQCSEGPATGHLDTGFSWFPCV